MALRGVTPDKTTKRLKLGIYGGAGVGKTSASIRWPHVYFIDTERGAENDQYVDALREAGGAYLFTNDLAEIVSEVRALLTERHKYHTLVIDPITVPYNEALDRSALDGANATKGLDGTEFGRHKIGPDRTVKRLFGLLMQLDMNVIVTFHQKALWEGEGPARRVIGNTFDGFSKSDYLFDLMLEAQKRGEQRVAIVKKSRIEAFQEGAVIPLSYDEIANRYGRNLIERDASPVEIVNEERLARLAHLLDVVKVDEAKVSKMLAKYDVDEVAELPAKAAEEVIRFLEKQVNPEVK